MFDGEGLLLGRELLGVASFSATFVLTTWPRKSTKKVLYKPDTGVYLGRQPWGAGHSPPLSFSSPLNFFFRLPCDTDPTFFFISQFAPPPTKFLYPADMFYYVPNMESTLATPIDVKSTLAQPS